MTHNKDTMRSTKQNYGNKKIVIKESITETKAQQLYRKYIRAMKILEDK